MKNTLRHIKTGLMALSVLILTASCLDKYPQSSIPEDKAMKSFSDAEQHLIGIYASLKSSSLYSGLLTLLPDIQADLVYAIKGNSNTYGNFWQWQVRSTDQELEYVYGALYTTIGNCNFYLENIEAVMAAQVDDKNIDLLEQYTGEVYTIRALCYLELLKCYCKAYDPDTAQNELGVVLRTKYKEKQPAVRASLHDSYLLVLSDLEEAEKRLSDKDEDNAANSVYITAAAAWALHARVALYMQDWQTAIDYSSKLIDDKKNLFQLASVKEAAADGASKFDYMWAYDQGPEVIWKIEFTATSYGGYLGDLFLGFRRDFSYFYPDYVPAAWALDAYDTNDVRYSSYFAGKDQGIEIGFPSGMDWPLLVKYYGNRRLIGTSPTTFMHMSIPKVFRLAEQYLIRAEAYCNLPTPNYSAASKDVTALRTKRYLSGGTLNLSNNWKEQLADERMRELYMEGFRLHDLKRWNMGFTRKKQAFSQQEGSELKIEAGDPRFVWPIPQHELDAPGSEILPNESNK